MGVERCRGRPGPCLPNPIPGPVRVPVLVPWGLDLGVLLGGLLEAWRPELGVWNVVGGGLVRACLTLTLAQYKSRSWTAGAWTWGPSLLWMHQ